MTPNQNPEQIARDTIDQKLTDAGWVIQENKAKNPYASLGVAIREFPTEVGPADYVLFVQGKACGVIEAKRLEEGQRMTIHEEQSGSYASSRLKWVKNKDPLRFIYESTGVITRFTEGLDPHPRSRELFKGAFFRPETLQQWLREGKSLRSRLLDIPALPEQGLRQCQIIAINNLEQSFRENKPRALVQMATGSGKTFTAITQIYRLLKFAKAKRILFLVDTRNLGKQAEQEFMAYTPSDDHRKFTELYNVQRLLSPRLDDKSQVVISTIQRMYSMLKGEELEEKAEDVNPWENGSWRNRKPPDVAYNQDLPPEYFDFIVIDECHRSIYNLWRQVLDYFDAFFIGLTATPDKRTIAFFNSNLVSEYDHQKAVIDGVNVQGITYLIETRITKEGGKLEAQQAYEKREKLSRSRRWETLDEDLEYTGKDLDRSVVSKDTIRNIAQCYRDSLPNMFPGRDEVPKTLIFAKDDSHAEDIVEIVREVFGQGNKFCKKVTYKKPRNKEEAKDYDPEKTLVDFRNSYYPRISVTVDMIATGTDVKPLECLIFMRDVKSRNYFEQMKGRGTRTCPEEEMQKTVGEKAHVKTHYVLIDAVGVTKSVKTDSYPFERKPGVSLKELLNATLFGEPNEDDYTSLAGRLARLDREISPKQREDFKELTGGISIAQIAQSLLDTFDPDLLEEKANLRLEETGQTISADTAREEAQKELSLKVKKTLGGEVIEWLVDARKQLDQWLDTETDEVLTAGWDESVTENAAAIAEGFREYIESQRDEITALRILYNQPRHRAAITLQMAQEVLDALRRDKPGLAPARVWNAYARLDDVKIQSPEKDLITLVALLRRVCGADEKLTSYEQVVRRNFQRWVMQEQAGPVKFNEDQMQWLHYIRDFVSASLTIEADDLENHPPFNQHGGLWRFAELFPVRAEALLEELNDALAA